MAINLTHCSIKGKNGNSYTIKLYGKVEDRMNEYQKRLIETLYNMKEQVENGKLPLKDVVDSFNSGLPDVARLTRKKVGTILRKDFELTTKKSTHNLTFLIWETSKIQKLFSKVTSLCKISDKMVTNDY